MTNFEDVRARLNISATELETAIYSGAIPRPDIEHGIRGCVWACDLRLEPYLIEYERRLLKKANRLGGAA
jgi:hypothetical protein